MSAQVSCYTTFAGFPATEKTLLFLRLHLLDRLSIIVYASVYGSHNGHHGIYRLEESLHSDDLRGYRALVSKVEMPIAVGENESTVAGFMRLMDEADVSIVQVDVTRVGLAQARGIAFLAHQHGLPCAKHNFTSDINVAASLFVFDTKCFDVRILHGA